MEIERKPNEKKKTGPKGPQMNNQRYKVSMKQIDGTFYELGIFPSQTAIANRLSNQLNEKFNRSTIDNILRGRSNAHSKWIKIIKL